MDKDGANFKDKTKTVEGCSMVRTDQTKSNATSSNLPLHIKGCPVPRQNCQPLTLQLHMSISGSGCKEARATDNSFQSTIKNTFEEIKSVDGLPEFAYKFTGSFNLYAVKLYITIITC